MGDEHRQAVDGGVGDCQGRAHAKYRNKDRVFTPETLDEFFVVLSVLFFFHHLSRLLRFRRLRY